MKGTPARLAAARAVGRVLREGAYTNRVISAESQNLDTRDRALAQHLVLATIRHLPTIDAALTQASSRPLDRVDPALLDVLRVGVADLHYTSTPAHAAVSVAVDVAKAHVGDKAAGFANAVLRAVGNTPIPEVDPWGWIRPRLEATFGTDDADAFLEASARPAAIGVRWRRPPVLDGTPVPGIESAAYLDGPEGVAEEARAGTLIVADPASTFVGLSVAPRPGETVLDMAAAPGGKTVHLWDQMHAEGLLVAADAHPRRLERARRRLDAIGVQARWMLMDGRRPAFTPHSFDRILLDAPCTGLGTVRRRPEIVHRLDPDAPARLGRLQRALLESALGLVRPGGRVVYAVCTVFPEETIDVVAGLGASPPAHEVGRVWGDGVLLAPHLSGTDGMFVSVIEP